MRRNSSRAILATGLLVSAILVADQGGWPGLLLAGTQVVVALALMIRRESPWPPAWAILALVVGPMEAGRHWTAQLPGSCRCARLPRPPPGLVSVTGAAVLVDLVMLALAVWISVANRQSSAANQVLKLEKSSPS